MAKLINGNGNPAVYASEDADLIASIMGNQTSICAVGSEFAETASGANTIEVADGVIITKEGRRIQLDAGSVDEFTIPAGTAGTTNYYIIGYKLYENAEAQQVCETFVQLMNSSSETITEDTFKGGATEVYVSLYRVEQDGVNLGDITLLLPKVGNITGLNADLTAYYDSSTNKWYVRNPDGTKGSEIPMNRIPDYDNAVSLTLNTDYTVPSDGLVISIGTDFGRSELGAVFQLTIDDIPVIGAVLTHNNNNSAYDRFTYENCEKTVGQGSVIHTPTSGLFKYVPYK